MLLTRGMVARGHDVEVLEYVRECRIADHTAVAAEQHNGYPFDPTDPAAIATALERMVHTPAPKRTAMGHRSHQLALR